MRRVHGSAVRGSALARVLECDMRLVGAGFVFLISAESASSCRVRSVAEHGWFGSEHGICRLLPAEDDSKIAPA